MEAGERGFGLWLWPGRRGRPKGPHVGCRVSLWFAALLVGLSAFAPVARAQVPLPPPTPAPTPPQSAPPAPPPPAGDPIRIVRAELVQHAFSVELRVRVAQPLRRTDLTAGGRQLCAFFRGSVDRRGVVPVCLGRRSVRVGRRVRRQRPSFRGREIRVTLDYGPLGGHPGRLFYRLGTEDSACVRAKGAGCSDSYPPGRPRVLRLKQPRPVGCVRHGAPRVNAARRKGKKIAITFDDGPAPATPRVLRILKRFHAHATFFQLGQQLRGRRRLERQILAAGDQLANHSYNHPSLPSRSQLSLTSRLITGVAGYRPCLFRPPYGALDSRLVGDARSLNMTTVVWDVDPRDWSTPGVGAIESRVLGAAHSGSIVLLHDGGGPRGQTVAALPRILRSLKRRGYRLVTVGELLHYRTRYVPR